MASTLRPFLGHDVSSLATLPIYHQHIAPSLVPLSLTASPSTNNILTIVQASWESSDNIISRLVLSPSLPHLSRASQPSAKIKLVSFSCTCVCSCSREHGAGSDCHHPIAINDSEEAERKAELMQYKALCPHLLSMISVISKSPESVVYHQAALGSFEFISPAESHEILRSLLVSPKNFSLSSAASHLEAMIKQKQLPVCKSEELHSQDSQNDPHTIQQEAIAAATSSGTLLYGTLHSLLPNPSFSCFSSSISTQLKEMIDIQISLHDDRSIASKNKRKINDTVESKQFAQSFERRQESDLLKFESLCNSLTNLLEVNWQFIKLIFEYECPDTIDADWFNGHGWIYLVEMADAVLKNKDLLANLHADYHHLFQKCISRLGDAFWNAVTDPRSSCLLQTAPIHEALHRWKTEVAPNLIIMCASITRSHVARLFVRADELINGIPCCNAYIASIISDEEIPGGIAVQKTLLSESHDTAHRRLSCLAEQGNYIGASRLAFAFDSMDILAEIALESSEEVFECLFAAMVDVIYSSPKTRVLQRHNIRRVASKDPDTPLPSYLTFSAFPRTSESLSRSASFFAARVKADGHHPPVRDMKIWTVLFALMDYGVMYRSGAIGALKLMPLIVDAPNVAKLRKALSKVSEASRLSQRKNEIPSLCAQSAQVVVYTAASLRPPVRRLEEHEEDEASSCISTAGLLSKLQMLDWDYQICARFRSTCIFSMALGLANRDMCTEVPSTTITDHAISFFRSLITALCSDPFEFRRFKITLWADEASEAVRQPDFSELEIIWKALNDLLMKAAARRLSFREYPALLSLSDAFCRTPKRFIPLIASGITPLLHGGQPAASRSDLTSVEIQLIFDGQPPQHCLWPLRSAGYSSATANPSESILHVFQDMKRRNVALFNEFMNKPSLIESLFSSSLSSSLTNALELIVHMFRTRPSSSHAKEMYRSITTALLPMCRSDPIPKPALDLIVGHIVSQKRSNKQLFQSCSDLIAFILSSANFVAAHCKVVVGTAVPKTTAVLVEDVVSCLRDLHSGEGAVSQLEIEAIRSFLSHDITHSAVLPILCKYYSRDMLYGIIEPKIASEMSLTEQFASMFCTLGKRTEMLRFMDYRGFLDSDTSDAGPIKVNQFFVFVAACTRSISDVNPLLSSALKEDSEFKNVFIQKLVRVAQSFSLAQISAARAFTKVEKFGPSFSALEQLLGPPILYIYQFWRFHGFLQIRSDSVLPRMSDALFERRLNAIVPELLSSVGSLVVDTVEVASLIQTLNPIIEGVENPDTKALMCHAQQQISERLRQETEGFIFTVCLGPISVSDFSSSLQAIAFADYASGNLHLKKSLELVINRFHETHSEEEAERMYQSIKTVLLRKHQSSALPQPALEVIVAHVVSLKNSNILLDSCRRWVSCLLSTSCFIPAHCQTSEGSKMFEDIVRCLLFVGSSEGAANWFEIGVLQAFLSNSIKHSIYLPILAEYYGRNLLYSIIKPSIASQMTLTEQFSSIFIALGKRGEMLTHMDHCGSLDSDTCDVVKTKINIFFDFLRAYTLDSDWSDAVNQNAEFKAAFIQKIVRIAQSFSPSQVSAVLSSKNLDDRSSSFLQLFGSSLLYIYRFWRLHAFLNSSTSSGETNACIIEVLQAHVPDLTIFIPSVDANRPELTPLLPKLTGAAKILGFDGITSMVSHFRRQVESRPVHGDGGFRVYLGPIIESGPSREERFDASKRPKHG